MAAFTREQWLQIAIQQAQLLLKSLKQCEDCQDGVNQTKNPSRKRTARAAGTETAES